MGDLDARARKRITQWIDTSPTITQAVLAREIGESPSWLSRALRGEGFDADLDRLAKILRVFQKSWPELLDDYPATPSGELAYRFDALPREAQERLLRLLQVWTPEVAWPSEEPLHATKPVLVPATTGTPTKRGSRPK